MLERAAEKRRLLSEAVDDENTRPRRMNPLRAYARHDAASEVRVLAKWPQRRRRLAKKSRHHANLPNASVRDRAGASC